MLDATKQTAIIADEMLKLKAEIIANMRSANEVASGRTIQSMQVIVADNGLSVALVGRSPFGTLETGRKAGKVPYRFSDIIYEWMQAKGLHGTPIPYKRNTAGGWSPQERGDRRMASAIAHTIAVSGTKLHRSGGRADIYSNVIPQTVNAISERLGALYDEEITKVIKLNGGTTVAEEEL